jgi:4'-phosphopantetheinyl transferase EntD
MTVPLRQAAVEAALATLFPLHVAVAAERISPSQNHALWPEELASIAGAVPARRAEFAAGRTAARRCLAALGRVPGGLAIGKDRAAIWPNGVFGSISHAHGLAVAAAGLSAPLGVDLELDEAIEPDLWPVVCTADELAMLPRDDPGRWVRRAFAAKEAVFKAQAPEERVMFGFDAVQITLAGEAFVARFLQDQGRFATGTEIGGRLAYVQGLVLAGVSQ